MILLPICGAIRLGLLATRPFWHDELFTLWAARLSLPSLIRALRQDSGPPLFYLLERPWVHLAEALHADSFARVLPWIAAFTLFAAAAHLPSGAERLWFLGLAAASPLLLVYAAEARSYAVLALLDLAAFFLLFRGQPTVRRMAVAAVVLAAAVWTHYLALFFLAGAGLLLVATRRWRGAAAVAAAGLAFLPWAPVLLVQPAAATAWIQEPARRWIPDLLASLGGSGRIPNPLGGPLPPVLVLAGVATGAALLFLAAAGARANREAADALSVTGLTLAFLVAASLLRPLAFPGRSEMAVLPIWLWAVARTTANGRASRWAAGAAIAIAVLSSAWLLANPRSEAVTLKLARETARLARPGDTVVAGTSFYLPARLAADRGELPAEVFAFPDEIAAHPGWYVPRAPEPADYRSVEARLATVHSGARVFLLLHPFYAGPPMMRILAESGETREIVRRRDGVLIVWTRRRVVSPQ